MRLIARAIVALLAIAAAQVAHAHPPWGIALDREGRVFFSNLVRVGYIESADVWVVVREGPAAHIHDFAFDGDGTLRVHENAYEPGPRRFTEAIFVLPRDGEPRYEIEPTDALPHGAGVLRDAAGNTYGVVQNVAQDNRRRERTVLYRRTPAGESQVLAGGRYGHADGQGESARFSSIVGMAFGADGALHVADGAHVRKVTMDGRVTTLGTVRAADSAAARGALMGIAVDARGTVYVADHAGRCVRTIAPDGVVAEALCAQPPWAPTGVAVARDGTLHVLEIDTTIGSGDGPRVRRRLPDGTVEELIRL